jgi:hypothetical protein
MPGKSYGLPTANCITGSKLAEKEGTICSECYAKKGFYSVFAHQVVPAQQRRLASIDGPEWVPAMITVLQKETHFRWLDSGDLQSLAMLEKIVEVVRLTPWCKHWIATRERSIVRRFLMKQTVPANAVIRLSATYADKPVKLMKGAHGANVHKALPPVGFECRAPKQGGACGTCRACWSRKVELVSYKKH